MNTLSQRPSPPFSCFSLPLLAREDGDKPRLIEPTYSSEGVSSIEFHYYVDFIEQTLRSILNPDFLHVLSGNVDPEAIASQMIHFERELPLITRNEMANTPFTLRVSILCPSEYTQGVGRYICDALSRWLVPGKCINISSIHSLNFNFVNYPAKQFYFHQVLLDIETQDDLQILKAEWKRLQKEMQVSILSVRHARHIHSVKGLTFKQKNNLIGENIHSMVQGSAYTEVFHRMHDFLLQIKAADLPPIKQRKKNFDRTLFKEMKQSFHLFSDRFMTMRDLRYISRLISFFYLFRHQLTTLATSSPQERHLTLKLLKTKICSSHTCKPVLGILAGVNVLRESEPFEERHIIDAVESGLPGIHYVRGSLILDRRIHDPIRLFYLEIEKKHNKSFSLADLAHLKKELPRQLKDEMERAFHPVVMPRNEEEIMRNILLLSQELKFLNDIPQVIISYETQTENALHFRVVLLRLMTKNARAIKEILATASLNLKIEECETKKVGLLRKKYPKEATILQISLKKKEFLRKDFTINLLKARQALSHQLYELFDGIRDFNGGILSKQQEVFQELKSLLKENASDKDFLIENFFYAITPSLNQMLLSPSSLKSLFSLLQEALATPLRKEKSILKTSFEEDRLFLVVAFKELSLKKEFSLFIHQLQIPSEQLSSTTVDVDSVHYSGYIYHNRDPRALELFHSRCLQQLQKFNGKSGRRTVCR